MLNKHNQGISQVMDIEALKAWQAFSLVFWTESNTGLSDTQQSELFHAGFLRSRWALYDLQEHGKDSYLSDFQAFCLQTINAKYQTVLADRMLCGHVMANYFYVPTTYCVVSSERVQWLDVPWWEDGQPRPSALQLHVDANFSLQKLGLPKSNDPAAEQQLLSHLHEESQRQGASITVSDAMSVHPALTKMAEESFLYVLMVRDPHEERSEPIAITLALSRYSNRHGRSVLCVEEGAVSASIDFGTGMITECRMLNEEGRLERLSRHPDSNILLLGQRLPEWDSAREALMRFFDESSYLRYCHLTFVITERGLGFVSAQPYQMAAHQMHRPLLDNISIDDYLNRLSQ